MTRSAPISNTDLFNSVVVRKNKIKSKTVYVKHTGAYVYCTNVTTILHVLIITITVVIIVSNLTIM